MKYAWVTLTAKVYVDDDEMKYELSDLENMKPLTDEEHDEYMDNLLLNTPIEKEKEVFQLLAMEKITDHFLADEPMKINDIEIDMSTYK